MQNTKSESGQPTPDLTPQQPSSAKEQSEQQSANLVVKLAREKMALQCEVQELKRSLDATELRFLAEVGKKLSAEKALAEAYALRSEEIRGLHAAVERERELVTLLYAQIASLTPTTEVDNG